MSNYAGCQWGGVIQIRLFLQALQHSLNSSHPSSSLPVLRFLHYTLVVQLFYAKLAPPTKLALGSRALDIRLWQVGREGAGWVQNYCALFGEVVCQAQEAKNLEELLKADKFNYEPPKCRLRLEDGTSIPRSTATFIQWELESGSAN